MASGGMALWRLKAAKRKMASSRRGAGMALENVEMK